MIFPTSPKQKQGAVSTPMMYERPTAEQLKQMKDDEKNAIWLVECTRVTCRYPFKTKQKFIEGNVSKCPKCGCKELRKLNKAR